MRRYSASIFISVCFAVMTGFAFGEAVTATAFVPETTKGIFVVPDVNAIETSWDEIDLGKLAADPAVQPFMDDVQAQIQSQLDKTGVRVGISLEELFEVCTGEIAVAFIEPRKGAQKHAVATIADVVGKAADVAKMRKTIQATMVGRKAKGRTENVNGVELDIYTVPIKIGGRKTFQAVFFTTQDKVVAVDHEDVAKEILALIQGGGGKTLAGVAGYVQTMQRVTKESAGLTPHLYGWVEPLKYAELMREAAAIQKKRRWDLIESLNNQGFDAIVGLGGHLNLDAKLSDGSSCDLLWRAYCHAPPVKGAGKERYELAARLLALPGKDTLDPEAWVSDETSSYGTATWDIAESYEYIDTLVDEIAGEPGFFDDLIASLKEDPNGPMIDLKRDIVDHLGTRATVMTDCQRPVSLDSERFIVAISLNNADKLKKTLAKMLGTDPNAQLLEIDGHEIWEIINEDVEVPVVAVEAGGFTAFENDDEDDGDGAPAALMGNAALSVVKGHLLISSHVDYIVEVMRRKPKEAKLGNAADYLTVQAALAKLGSTPNDTLRLFSRADKELEATYEFIRGGQMPDSKGLFGRMLNQLLNTPDQEGRREQQLDGTKMPKYAAVQKYLGVLGVYLNAEDEGWYGAGVGLSRADAKLNAARPVLAEDGPAISTANRDSDAK